MADYTDTPNACNGHVFHIVYRTTAFLALRNLGSFLYGSRHLTKLALETVQGPNTHPTSSVMCCQTWVQDEYKTESGTVIAADFYHSNTLMPLSDEEIVTKVKANLVQCEPSFRTAKVHFTRRMRAHIYTQHLV